jgi:hypothetical protein
VLKKTITYTDFNGDEVSEDFYFHLSKAELIEIEMSHKGGLSEALKKIIAADDGATIISEFKKIILSAYGERSEDGKRFVKTQQLREEFESSEAYSTLFVELVTNADSAAEFVNGVVPADLAEEAVRISALAAVPDPKPVEPEVVVEPELLTRQQLVEMPQEEFREVWAPRIQRGEVQIGD